MNNPLVGLLRTYGPSAASSSLFDEHVRDEVRRHNVREIKIPAPYVEEIGRLIKGEAVTNVILTGTAGDGKTYHIRKVFMDELGGHEDDWPGDVIKSVPLPNNRELRIIRDLTEVPAARKKEELTHITRCLLGEDPNVSYLVAANDGQLLMLWREASEEEGADKDRHETVLAALSTMLREEQREDPSGRLRLNLFNLSRDPASKAIDGVIDAMLDHEHWEAGCHGCPLAKDAEAPCPILLNRSLLRGAGEGEASSRFRTRLREVIDLAACNDRHVPIRQLFALVSNIILGTNRNPDHPLLDCEQARRIARDRAYSRTNPYNNALGLNLRDERRRNNAIFSILDTFGLGQETNNALDDLLLTRRPAETFDTLGDEDHFYGEDIFSEQRNRYVSSSHEAFVPATFKEAMETQRRRLFFRMKPLVSTRTNGPMLDPWALTVFHHAGLYLEFREAVRNRAKGVVVDDVCKKLVKGVNRTLTGMMTDDSDTLWLAGTIGRTDDPTGRISTQEAISRLPGGTFFHVKIGHSDNRNRPFLSVGLNYQAFGQPSDLPQLDLRLIIFEYLMRVSAGSLPSSFSRQCHQEVRRFAMMLSQEILLMQGGKPGDRVGILSITDRGIIQRDTIEVGQ